jgi:hypothetical protein
MFPFKIYLNVISTLIFYAIHTVLFLIILVLSDKCTLVIVHLSDRTKIIYTYVTEVLLRSYFWTKHFYAVFNS